MLAFISDLTLWRDTGDDLALIRALRSPYSGVPHDIAAAYATIARRAGPLLDAIASERLALPSGERDAVFSFSQRVRAVRSGADVRDVFPERERHGTTNDVSSPGLSFAQPADFEQGPTVPARRGHFSASSLNTYAECARKWYYRYVCAALEDPGSSASTYGTAFHKALEDFHADFPRPRAADETAMRSKIQGNVNWSFERFRDDFTSAVEVELHKRRAQRTAARYVDWLVCESQRAPFTVVGRELDANLEIEGYAFVGFIDRVDRDDATGAVTIVDYKTGSIANTANDYREKVRQFKEFQLPLYYWARTAQGDRVTKLALIPLKDALLEVRPVALEVIPGRAALRRDDSPVGTVDIADLERARARMIEICAELTSGTLLRFPVTDDPTACTYCAYKIACVDRPLAQRERFSR